MWKISLICIMAAMILGLFYLVPTDQVSGEPGDSPLYAASLDDTKDFISDSGNPGRGTESKGGGAGNLITCEITCGPTCNQITCGTTCVATCEFTCTSTCSQPTCGPTCAHTCESTCVNTCSQLTCESTCVVTCSYTCTTTQITLVTFTAQADAGQVILKWTTASEIANYGFIIRRSTDPEGDFAVVAEVLSQPHSSGTTDYSFIDRDVQPGVTYYYALADLSLSGFETPHPLQVNATPWAVYEFQLLQNYPNPFNPATTIAFELRDPTFVNLEVFDTSGRRIAKLVEGWQQAGRHQVIFNGSELPSGVYLYRLRGGEMAAVGKMTLMK